MHTRGASATTTPSPRASHLRARSVPFVRDTGLPWVIPFPVTSGQTPLACQARVAPHCPAQDKTPNHHQRRLAQGAPLAEEEVTKQERERQVASHFRNTRHVHQRRLSTWEVDHCRCCCVDHELHVSVTQMWTTLPAVVLHGGSRHLQRKLFMTPDYTKASSPSAGGCTATTTESVIRVHQTAGVLRAGRKKRALLSNPPILRRVEVPARSAMANLQSVCKSYADRQLLGTHTWWWWF